MIETERSLYQGVVIFVRLAQIESEQGIVDSLRVGNIVHILKGEVTLHGPHKPREHIFGIRRDGTIVKIEVQVFVL